MELTRPLGLAGIGFGFMSGLIEYLTGSETWVAATAIVGVLIIILAACSWRWKWEIVSRAVRPDWTAFDAYMYIAFSEFGREHGDEQDWFDSIRQYAASDKVTIFGRAARVKRGDSKNPLQPIRAAFWLVYEIEETTMVSQPEDITGPMTRLVGEWSGVPEVYEDLHFSSFQVRQRWKKYPLRKRIHFRNPLKTIFYIDP